MFRPYGVFIRHEIECECIFSSMFYLYFVPDEDPIGSKRRTSFINRIELI